MNWHLIIIVALMCLTVAALVCVVGWWEAQDRLSALDGHPAEGSGRPGDARQNVNLTH